MRVVIQRVKQAQVEVENETVGEIKQGLLLLVSFENEDGQEDIDWICNKVVNMRIFSDDADKMNLSVKDIDGGILLVSQFTLHASCKKGNRPSFMKAAKPKVAIPLYEQSIETFNKLLGNQIETGQFGADMQVSLMNDGPVTIILDSKIKE